MFVHWAEVSKKGDGIQHTREGLAASDRSKHTKDTGRRKVEMEDVEK